MTTYINLPTGGGTTITAITDIPPITDGTVPGAAQIGGVIVASQAAATSTNVAATGIWGYATSINLSAGVWQVVGMAGFSENGAVMTTSVSCGISSTTDGTGLSLFDYAVYNQLVSGANDSILPTGLPLVISINAATDYYLNTRMFYSSGSPQHYGKIQARRIA